MTLERRAQRSIVNRQPPKQGGFSNHQIQRRPKFGHSGLKHGINSTNPNDSNNSKQRHCCKTNRVTSSTNGHPHSVRVTHATPRTSHHPILRRPQRNRIQHYLANKQLLLKEYIVDAARPPSKGEKVVLLQIQTFYNLQEPASSVDTAIKKVNRRQRRWEAICAQQLSFASTGTDRTQNQDFPETCSCSRF